VTDPETDLTSVSESLGLGKKAFLNYYYYTKKFPLSQVPSASSEDFWHLLESRKPEEAAKTDQLVFGPV